MNFVPKKPGEEIDERFCTIGKSERVEEEEHFWCKKIQNWPTGRFRAKKPGGQAENPLFSPCSRCKTSVTRQRERVLARDLAHVRAQTQEIKTQSSLLIIAQDAA